MSVRWKLLSAAVVAMSLGWGAASAQAADGCWSNPSGGEWTNPANWRNGVIPGPGDVATLNGISGGCNMPATVTMASDVSVGVLSSPFTRVEVAAGKTLTVTGDAGDDGSSTIALAANARLHVPAGAVFRPSASIEMDPTAQLDVEGTVYPINGFTTVGGTANFSAASLVRLASQNMFLGDPTRGRTKVNLQGTVDMSGGYKGGIVFLYPTADSPASNAAWVGPPDSLIAARMVNQTAFVLSGPLAVGDVELTDGTLHLTGGQACGMADLTLFHPSVIDLDGARSCTVSGKLDLRNESQFGGRSGAGTLTAATADLTGGRFDGGGLTRVTGAAVIGGSGSPIIRGGATLRTDGATAWQSAGVQLGAPGEGGTWENAGTLTIDSSKVNNNGVPLALADGGGSGVLRNLAGATIVRQAPVGEFAANARIENAGTIDVQAGTVGKPGGTGTIAQSGGATHVAAGATLDLDVAMSGGVLKGNGTVRDVVNSGGTVAPGESPGALTIAETYAQGAGGTLEAELAGTAPEAFDRLVVIGAATLGGTVRIVRTPAFLPALANTFKIVQSGSRTGEFASLTGDATAPGGLVFGAAYQADGATLCFAGGGLCPGTAPQPPAPEPAAPAAPTPPVTPPGQAPVTGASKPPATKPVTAVSITTIASLPPVKSCVSRRAFKIRLRVPKGMKVASAEVRIAGKRVKVLKGKRLTSQVTLTGLPKGTFVVQITLNATDGTKVTGKRTYHTCVPKQKSSKKGPKT